MAGRRTTPPLADQARAAWVLARIIRRDKNYGRALNCRSEIEPFIRAGHPRIRRLAADVTMPPPGGLAA